MKKFFPILFLFSLLQAQWSELHPYVRFRFHGFEHVAEANGLVAVFGPTYKTSIRLIGCPTPPLFCDSVHNGDSAFVAFVNGPHGSTDCNYPVDSCQRHRGYVIDCFRCHNFGDSTGNLYHGIRMNGPVWVQMWYKWENMTLGPSQWESQITFCRDSSDSCYHPVTTGRNQQNYLFWEHTPLFDSTAWTYQLDSIKDPAGKYKVTPKKWHLIQAYLDDDSANGVAYLFVDGILHSSANVRGGNRTLAYFHAGLYCSPSVAHGTVYNDDLLIAHVPNLAYAMLVYMAFPPIRGPP